MIPITYSCHACGIVAREVQVEERSPEGDVDHWMRRTVAVTVSLDHSRMSPFCEASRMTELHIPIEGRAYVGGPIKQ